MTGKCYQGKILHIDLTNGKTRVESPPESFYRTYGGGSAMGMYYILKGMSHGIEPFSPENILTFFLGVPTGLPISGLSRISVNAKSPLSGAIGDSQAGGFFPARMKSAGYDGIVVQGRAPKPVYLWIHNGKVEIRDAGRLWGKITGEAEDILKQEIGDDKIDVLQIGPAGESLVRFAAIINMCRSANGRTGMGAVMGSKNLKAIAVQGKDKIRPADSEKLRVMFKMGTGRIPKILETLQLHGTAGDVSGVQWAGGLPTFNYNEGQFAEYEAISGERMTESILTGRDTCFSCTVGCKRVVETEYKGQKVSRRYGGPEYETMATFGSYCGVSDMKAIAMANQLCNQYGVDTIACGATIAFAMECFENGVIGMEDTGGIDLHFGNAESMVKMVELIVKREGFGDILAEGSERAAKKIGKNADEYLITSKGTEAPAHMPQQERTTGLIYAVNPFGADHMSTEHDPFYEKGESTSMAQQRLAELGLTKSQPPGSVNTEKARLVYITQKFFSANDSYNLCSFVWGVGWQLYGPEETVEMLRAATGWDITIDEYLEVGERRFNMMRAFNAREGLTRQNDTLAKKFFRPLQGSGPHAGVHFTHEQFETLKDEYYRLAGWDITTGNPTPQKLKSLRLDWVEI